jgi:hypothetical protein
MMVDPASIAKVSNFDSDYLPYGVISVGCCFQQLLGG